MGRDDLLRFAASGVVCVRGAVNKKEKKKPRHGRGGFRKGEAVGDAEDHHHGGLFPATTIAHAVSTRRRDNFEETEITNFPSKR